MAEPSNREESASVGCVVLIVFVGLIIYAGYKAYYSIKGYDQPGLVSLAAYFVDGSGNSVADAKSDTHLKVKGTAFQANKPLEGNVRLSVAKIDKSFEQTVALEAKGGQFESEDVAFRSLTPMDKLHVTAEVSSANLPVVATQEVYLNAPQPMTTTKLAIVVSIIVVLGLAILAFFFSSFTGQRNPRKNRNAIIFSYLFGGIFLGVPLLAPILLLKIFPEVQRAMIGMPVGVVLTKLDTDKKYQWVLNIGGYSRIPTAESKKSESPGGSPTPTPTPATSPNPGARATASATPAPTVTPTPLASPTAQPTQAVATTSPAPRATPSASPGNSASAKASSASDANADEWDGVVELEGGLVIPLYVIILSVIGGAINMTRKVPRFQGEGEYYEPAAFRPSLSPWANIKKFGVTMWRKVIPSSTPAAGVGVSLMGAEPDAGEGPSLESLSDSSQDAGETAQSRADQQSGAPQTESAKPSDQEAILNTKAKAIDTQLGALVTQQVLRNSDTRKMQKEIQDKVKEMQKVFDEKTEDQRVLGFDSFEAWYGSRVNLREVQGTNWRVDLLNQYMYLISAPFLAIVAYYMLDLLSLTKQPILVLISFSVGLISERILTWLLGLASGYLRTNPSQSGAKP